MAQLAVSLVVLCFNCAVAASNVSSTRKPEVAECPLSRPVVQYKTFSKAEMRAVAIVLTWKQIRQ